MPASAQNVVSSSSPSPVPPLNRLLEALPENAAVLDAGAWFHPRPGATHVVDLMPYETRGCRLQLAPLPGERFSRETWHQVNFLAPDLRLPFPDRFFAFSICTHTIEDLADPQPLLSELQRVSLSGYLETPSRLAEQTIGIRDRMTNQPGHPHHHWIVEAEEGTLQMYAKADSLDENPASLVPHRWFEQHTAADVGLQLCRFTWQHTIPVEFIRGSAARARATAFARDLNVPPGARIVDSAIRVARRARSRLRGAPASTSDWWEEMLRLSTPYSRIPLR